MKAWAMQVISVDGKRLWNYEQDRADWSYVGFYLEKEGAESDIEEERLWRESLGEKVEVVEVELPDP